MCPRLGFLFCSGRLLRRAPFPLRSSAAPLRLMPARFTNLVPGVLFSAGRFAKSIPFDLTGCARRRSVKGWSTAKQLTYDAPTNHIGDAYEHSDPRALPCCRASLCFVVRSESVLVSSSCKSLVKRLPSSRSEFELLFEHYGTHNTRLLSRRQRLPRCVAVGIVQLALLHERRAFLK
jgi:hypothetical protein